MRNWESKQIKIIYFFQLLKVKVHLRFSMFTLNNYTTKKIFVQSIHDSCLALEGEDT